MPQPVSERPAGMNNPESNLVDRFGRRIEYLRLSVTDRCDLRCMYCLPKKSNDFEERENWLTFDEIERLLLVFARLGINRIRLTGGEPLLRHNLAKLATRLHRLPGIRDISLSTNATQLGKHAEALREAGITRINVSLDSLKHERFARITGRDCLDRVIIGLMAAKEAGFAPIKINMVALSGVNDDEIDGMVEFCMGHGFVLRLIETMPVGESGRNAQYLDLQPRKHQLQQRFNLVDGIVPGGGPARYLQTPDGNFSVGFITPISQHFCATCNRVRLTVDGTLYMCLGQNEKYEFRPLLRAGACDTELVAAIRAAIDLKPERHEFREMPQKIVRFMSATGG
ncbi:MAG: GTP 3',8-cyclase MoaA [Gammaproteobacteria bacterium]|nr:GTP 3',8-cyclase MoaA [Gammaproteobacteria bacterium]